MQDFIFQEVLLEFESIDSTNTEAKRQIDLGGKNVLCITATLQTKGRGRMERVWESSREGNLYMTIVCESIFISPEISEILPLYTAFSVMKAINSEIGSKAINYKWPNDLLIEGQKFGGILIEKYKGFFIIGIGINITSAPENTIFPATFLEKYNLSSNAKQIFESFQRNLETNKLAVINFLSENFFTKNEISINKGEFKGVFKKIQENGNLVLILENGATKEITVGDVSA